MKGTNGERVIHGMSYRAKMCTGFHGYLAGEVEREILDTAIVRWSVAHVALPR